LWNAERDWLDREFQTRQPLARLVPVFVVQSAEIQKLVHDGAVDVGVDIFPSKPFHRHPQLESYIYDRMMLVTHYEKITEDSQPISASPADINGLEGPFLLVDGHTGLREGVRGYLETHKIKLEQQFPPTIVDVLQRVETGMGVSILPEQLFKGAFQAERVDKLSLILKLEIATGVFFRTEDQKPGVKAVRACFREHANRPSSIFQR